MSLIEAISAMAIMSLACASLTAAFYQGSRYIRKEQQRTIAFFLAQEKMEELSSSDIFPNPASANNACYIPDSFPYYRATVNAANHTSLPGNLANVTVTVFWSALGNNGTINCNVNSTNERYVKLTAMVSNAQQ